MKKLIFLLMATFVFTSSYAQFFKKKNKAEETRTEEKADKVEDKQDKIAEKEAKRAEKEAKDAQKDTEKAEKKAEKEKEKAGKEKEKEAKALQHKWTEKEKKNPPFEHTKWVMLDISGKPLDGRTYFKLTDKGNKIVGNTGCNDLSGTYKKGRFDDVKFETITTKMACDNMKNEAALLNALNGANLYDINGTNLLLYHDSLLLAIFEANFD